MWVPLSSSRFERMIWVTFLSFKNDSYRVSLTEIWGTRGCWGSGFSGRGYVLIKRKRVEDVYFKALIKRKRDEGVYFRCFLSAKSWEQLLPPPGNICPWRMRLFMWRDKYLWGVDSGSPPESPLFLRGCNGHLPSNSRKNALFFSKPYRSIATYIHGSGPPWRR